jgi:hypothetical protein
MHCAFTCCLSPSCVLLHLSITNTTFAYERTTMLLGCQRHHFVYEGCRYFLPYPTFIHFREAISRLGFTERLSLLSALCSLPSHCWRACPPLHGSALLSVTCLRPPPLSELLPAFLFPLTLTNTIDATTGEAGQSLIGITSIAYSQHSYSNLVAFLQGSHSILIGFVDVEGAGSEGHNHLTKHTNHTDPTDLTNFPYSYSSYRVCGRGRGGIRRTQLRHHVGTTFAALLQNRAVQPQRCLSFH